MKKQKYPSDWQCKCGHLRKDHGGHGGFDAACKLKTTSSKYIRAYFIDDCVAYDPIDNLSYVERKANKRKR